MVLGVWSACRSLLKGCRCPQEVAGSAGVGGLKVEFGFCLLPLPGESDLSPLLWPRYCRHDG